MKILILGCTGMIGSSIYNESRKNKSIETFGTYRNDKKIKNKDKNLFKFNARKKSSINKIIRKIKPNFVINCIGLTKHIKTKDKNFFFEINSEFPHYVKKISNKNSSKFVQISTDCVFSGNQGNYSEKSKPDAIDIYGISKKKGEIIDNKNLTIRTSTIGHEIETSYGLLEWFLKKKKCYGYSKAYFNGFPTFYFSKILLKIILEIRITGLLHISGKKIDKYTLLKIIAKIYNKKIKISKNISFKIDRTLNNQKLKKYIKSFYGWNKLIIQMKKKHDQSKI
jgi:dTDP-4-dehydrorhamnose reductase